MSSLRCESRQSSASILIASLILKEKLAVIYYSWLTVICDRFHIVATKRNDCPAYIDDNYIEECDKFPKYGKVRVVS